MNPRSTPWLVAAVLEALAIAWIAWSLFAEPVPAAAEATPPTANASAAAAATPAASAPAATKPANADESPVSPPSSAATGAAASAAMDGCLVHGRARMRDGSALTERVSLALQPAGATKAMATASLSDSADAFAWAEVPAGNYELKIGGTGVRAATMAVLVPAGNAELRVDVELDASWRVRVVLKTPDGRLVHEVLTPELQQKLGLSFGSDLQVIALWQEVPDDLPGSGLRESPFTVARWQSARGIGRGGSKGDLPARYAGVLEMPEARDAHTAVVMKEVVLGRAPLAKGQQELELVVDLARLQASMATLRFVVVDRDGKPLSGAKVGVNDQQSWSQPIEVDGAGRYEKADLQPGLYSLSVMCAGHQFAPSEVTLRPGVVTDLGQIRAQPGREITIRLSGASEGKEPRGTLRLLEAPTHAALQQDDVELSFRKGEAKAPLVEGRYLLQVRGAGAARRIVDTRSLGDTPLVVELQAEAMVQVDSSATAAPTRLVLTTEDGTRVYDRWITWRSRWDLNLLPGRYQVETTPLGGAASMRSLDVPSDGAKLVL